MQFDNLDKRFSCVEEQTVQKESERLDVMTWWSELKMMQTNVLGLWQAEVKKGPDWEKLGGEE